MCDGNDEDPSAIAMELMMEYKDKCLILCAVNVAKFIEDAKNHSRGEGVNIDVANERRNSSGMTNLWVTSTRLGG